MSKLASVNWYVLCRSGCDVSVISGYMPWFGAFGVIGDNVNVSGKSKLCDEEAEDRNRWGPRGPCIVVAGSRSNVYASRALLDLGVCASS